MGKEGPAENVPEKMEKRIKSKTKKHKKNEVNSTGMDESQDISTMTEVDHVQRSENEDVEMKRYHKRDKEMKKNKGTKGAEQVQIQAKAVTQGKSIGLNGDGDAMDDAERKREKREKKKKKKNKSEGNETTWPEEDGLSGFDSGKEVEKERKKRAFETLSEGQNNDFAEETERTKKKKKKIKEQNDEVDLSSRKMEKVPENVEDNIVSNEDDGNVTKKLKKKKHKENESSKDDSSAAHQDISMQDNVENGSNGLSHTGEILDDKVEHAKKGKKKKKIKVVENTPNKSNKKVRFSGEVEVFTLPDDSNTNTGDGDGDNLVRGKRFTPEEDEIVKKAVYKYIKEHDLGDQGLDMVLNCSKYPELNGLCWKEIGSAIPYRPYTAIYYRAQVIFRRSEKRKWTPEEYEEILRYQEEHGNQWKALADELGKHRWHVKDTWRRIKLRNLKKGHWSQAEYQKLFDLVNNDIKLKVNEEKRSKHGMLRDNICWSAISDELSTRTNSSCCVKWYEQLTSRMVAEGIWADTDDYRLVEALYSLDATCMEDVEWDDLLEERSGDLCRKRWSQMVQHIGHHGMKSFAEQVEILAQRYCPDVLEAREAWDSKSRVP